MMYFINDFIFIKLHFTNEKTIKLTYYDTL